jgi:hypothetical protein
MDRLEDFENPGEDCLVEWFLNLADIFENPFWVRSADDCRVDVGMGHRKLQSQLRKIGSLAGAVGGGFGTLGLYL